MIVNLQTCEYLLHDFNEVKYRYKLHERPHSPPSNAPQVQHISSNLVGSPAFRGSLVTLSPQLRVTLSHIPTQDGSSPYEWPTCLSSKIHSSSRAPRKERRTCGSCAPSTPSRAALHCPAAQTLDHSGRSGRARSSQSLPLRCGIPRPCPCPPGAWASLASTVGARSRRGEALADASRCSHRTPMAWARVVWGHAVSVGERREQSTRRHVLDGW